VVRTSLIAPDEYTRSGELRMAQSGPQVCLLDQVLRILDRAEHTVAVREQLTPERLGILDESGVLGHGSHHAAEESGELTDQPGIQIRCPPAGHAVEVIVERASVPRRARSRPAQIIGPDLGQDGRGAPKALAQWGIPSVAILSRMIRLPICRPSRGGKGIAPDPFRLLERSARTRDLARRPTARARRLRCAYCPGW
jgi:hypothetical protein